MAGFRGFRIDWRAKAATFNLLDSIPFGNDAYYFLQRYVTRTLPRFRLKDGANLDAVYKHLATMRDARITPAEARILEIGAGWDFYQNLVLYMFGVNEQHLIDIRRWARPSAIPSF